MLLLTVIMAKRHAARRLEERYGSDNSNGLLKNLEREVSKGNFTAEASYPDNTSRGTVNLDGNVYEVVINNKTSKVITALPKGAMKEEKTRQYQGRARFSLK
jgi:hypothetical protein